MTQNVVLIHTVPIDTAADPSGRHVAGSVLKHMHIDTGMVVETKVYAITYPMSGDEAASFAVDCLQDPVIETVSVGKIAPPDGFSCFIAISRKPGVTDDEGVSVQKTLADYLGRKIDTKTQHIFTQSLYFLEKQLPNETLGAIASELLGNRLIHHFESGLVDSYNVYVPSIEIEKDATVETVDIFVDDDSLMRLSREMVLSLNLEEMKAIQHYYRNGETKKYRASGSLPERPTDCEIEIIAQTWSEHCKHKEFAAEIRFENRESGETRTIDSLFKTYIKGSTETVARKLAGKNNNWLIKVFSDNAGVVDLDENHTFVWKVETHNSPSAIDPYGGAITGILGNNRDPLGTGVGGGRLLFNTNVLCFGDPSYNGELAPGQLHPRRIFEGVVKGIEDGGNKSGIPTVNGAIIFDERYAGKPLVYCGTAGIMPKSYNGKKSWEKPIDAGDRIVMAGGRVGKDGIHGATFSSAELNEQSPASAVQIGSPITQKLMADFLERATERGLVKCSTDNGAGGLSSSVGELATVSNGAFVELEKVPLKYSGLRPWEIFVSESQERMTLVVEEERKAELFALASEMEVELTDIGRFTSDGMLTVSYNGKTAASLHLDFLHDGVPRKKLDAVWEKPDIADDSLPEMDDYTPLLHDVLGSLNVCSKEWVIRQYDHEVKGKTIIKPLMA
ncbi:MAG: AIR synthase-related protein, partial [Spirochaetota bacterium]